MIEKDIGVVEPYCYHLSRIGFIPGSDPILSVLNGLPLLCDALSQTRGHNVDVCRIDSVGTAPASRVDGVQLCLEVGQIGLEEKRSHFEFRAKKNTKQYSSTFASAMSERDFPPK